MIYKNDTVRIINFNYKDALYLHIYYDRSILNNKVNKKFGGYVKLKSLLKKKYLIDDGLGYVTITTKPKTKFIMSTSKNH